MKSFTQGVLDSASQQPNETTQFAAQSSVNREEAKMKLLLTGAYDHIHRETGKMIQKKLYKKAVALLDKFY